MARRCMAPARTEGNASYGRCPERPEGGRLGILRVGKVALAVWFCRKHFEEAFGDE